MDPILQIKNVSKIYDNDFQALNDINLEVNRGEIFALLGPNGAGKTTLIKSICGLSRLSSGTIKVAGFDIIKDYRQARQMIGLVPQELTTDAFEKVWDTVSFSRGLFGLKPNPAHIEETLKRLSLWDKKSNKLFTLSGGMKRRTMIAKALSHEPKLLFLDEPTAGVDVQLRESMWEQVAELKKHGVTIILTTHYIEEAEMMADRIGIINNGQLILVDEKTKMLQRLGKRKLVIELTQEVSSSLKDKLTQNPSIQLNERYLQYNYDTNAPADAISQLFKTLIDNNVEFKELETKQSSLQDIFVDIVRAP